MTDDIRALKNIRRKIEVIWRKNPLCINLEIFQESGMAVKHAIDENKTQVIQKKITESNGDQKKLFNIVNILLGCRKQLVLPDYNNPITLASTFNMFLLRRLQTIVQSFHCLRAHYPLVVVVVVCPLQPSSSVNSGCPGPESSILVSSRWACPISSQVTDH